MKRTIINPIVKDSITYVRTSAETNGTLTELELTLLPGGGNPLHYHKTFAESFTAISGDLALEVKGKGITILRPGESYTVPPLQVHRYFNNSKEEIRFTVKVEPGHEGFEYSLRIGYGLAADGLSNKKSIPKSLRHTAVLLTLGDINFSGIPGLLSPILRRLGEKAKAGGLERSLITKYCR